MTLAARIAFLRHEAEKDGTPVNEESLADFHAFMADTNAVRPALFLNDDGYFRALWKQGPEQIGLQFRGDGSVWFVLFAPPYRGAGRATTGDILQHIEAVGLTDLLHTEPPRWDAEEGVAA